MTFDFDAQERQILDRLATSIAESGLSVLADADQVDLTDSATAFVVAQIAFIDLVPADQVGRSAKHHAVWAFDLYIDTSRAMPTEKTAGAKLFSGAMRDLIGCEISAGREIRAEPLQRSGAEGRLRRRSFGFSIPVILAG